MATRITVSEFDRQMSEVLNRVAYQGERFIIERGGKAVARLEPVGPVRGVTLNEVVEKLGDLKIPEGFGDDLEAIRASIPKLEVPEWLR
ncbi:MAG: hypothetical protein HY690_01615 [Chloroflexi bacterium]|nr:hypothetical protein [Chloroflexota bacterium]